MTWEQFTKARRLLAEEFVGAARRAQAQATIDAENAAIEATKAAIRRQQR